MFLPVLLVRDFGLWGYAAFFIPNVLGAAAMGWVVRGPALTGAHLPAMRAFSMVTIAFQAYFAAWFARAAGASVWPVAAGAAALIYIALLRIGPLRGGLLAWLVSAGVFAWLAGSGSLTLPRSTPTLPESDVLFLAPVCAFGFGLCPYLDLTFHGAAAGAGPSQRAAFTLGFGALFAAMILFTLLYAPLLMSADGMRAGAPRAVMGVLAVHIFAQMAYTCAVHHSWLARSHPSQRAGALSVIVAAAALLAGLVAPLDRPFAGSLSLGEVIYRSFMAFYGLAFPAYVWLCVIPRRGPIAPPTRHALRVWALAVGIATPMFWKGFIARETWWLGPGLLIVLLARLALPKPTASAPGPSTA
jgi:hypothetical protein